MPEQPIVVVGASAGGVEALSSFCKGLPPGLPAAVFVVLHVSPASPSMLPAILERYTSLPVASAVDREEIRGGRIRVAPPDRHLLLADHLTRVIEAPRLNRHRPSIDVLFQSAARPSVIGVLLSGTGDDGAAGLGAIKAAGGTVLVQLPDDATFPGMPLNALRQTDVDHCLPSFELGQLVGRLVAGDRGSLSASS